MSRRISVGHPNPRTHSASSPAPVQMVSVAVLPPHLPTSIAPGTGVGRADAFSWDEALNWTRETPPPPGPSPSSSPGMGVPIQSAGAGAHEGLPGGRRKSSFLKKTGLTTERRRHNADVPPFVMKQVPFDTWRRHYAKDKEGNYKGTHAPAEDCLLKEHDVDKWRNKEEGVQGSRWTRGSEALPVYGEALGDVRGRVPGYEEDYENAAGARNDSAVAVAGAGGVGLQGEEYDRPPPEEEPVAVEEERPGLVQERTDRNTGLTYDAQKEREELAKRNQKPKGWRAKMKMGLEMATMGGGAFSG